MSLYIEMQAKINYITTLPSALVMGDKIIVNDAMHVEDVIIKF